MTRFFFLILAFIPLSFSAQEIHELLPDDELSLFDLQVITNENIEFIQAEISIKYDEEPIRKSRRIKNYHFEAGKVLKIVEVNFYLTGTDTIVKEYLRDERGRIIFKVESKSGISTVECLKYNEERLVGIWFYQMPKTATWNFQLSPENLIWCDSVGWSNNHAIYYNQYGHKQKEKRFEYNLKKEISSISSYDQSGKIYCSQRFEYNSIGKMILAEEINFNQHLYNWSKKFEYNETGKLSRIDYYKSGSPEYFRKISYDPNGLPDVDILRNEVEKKLIISQYKLSAKN